MPKFLIEHSAKPAVLLLGFTGILRQTLVNYLTEYSCEIFENQEKLQDRQLFYVWQKDNLNKLTKSLLLANQHKAKFILVSTEKNSQKAAKIQKNLEQIKGEVEVYFFNFPQIKDLNQANTLVKQMFATIVLGQKNQVTSKNPPKKTITSSLTLSNRGVFFLSFWLIFFSFLIYSILTFFCFYAGFSKVKQTLNFFAKNDFAAAKKQAEAAYQFFLMGDKMLNPVLAVAGLVSGSEAKTLKDGVAVSLLTANILSEAAFVAGLSQNLGQAILSARISLHPSQIQDLVSEIEELKTNVALLSTTLATFANNRSKPAVFFQRQKIFQEAEANLKQTKDLLVLLNQLTKILPAVLGFDQPKTFLLLFQNNSELRPTGGFIGSFGWVTFQQGRLIEFKTEDVYTADGQLKGHVPPPEPIRKYLNQENWYLRDSNFDPDFAVAASQAEWFLKHEMNLTFDGVFAFDLTSVEGILRAIGGVYLSDYGETITADNLFLKTQAASEIGFFPGSTQKRDFLGSLGRSIFIKLTSSPVNLSQLVKEVKQSLDHKHILLYFHQEEIQQLIEQTGWAGRLASVACQQVNCLADYLMLVEANLGINKANFLVERKAILNLKLTDNRLFHELILDYVNETPGSVYPSGPYFSYTRVFLPGQAEIKEVMVEKEQLKNEEIKLESYQDKKVIGFPFRLPANQTRKVKITYVLPVNQTQPINLQFLVQKQPGIKPFSFDLVFFDKPSLNKSLMVSADHLLEFVL